MMSHDCHSFSNYLQLHCLFNSLFSMTKMKTSNLCNSGPLWGKCLDDQCGLPSQRASNTERISMSWYHHAQVYLPLRRGRCVFDKGISWKITSSIQMMMCMNGSLYRVMCRESYKLVGCNCFLYICVIFKGVYGIPAGKGSTLTHSLIIIA